jgi:hypothetical protein
VWNVIPDRTGTGKIILMAEGLHDHGAITPTGLREEHLDPVQEWCEENKCGRRVAFHMFHFNTEKEVTAFLLRWS